MQQLIGQLIHAPFKLLNQLSLPFCVMLKNGWRGGISPANTKFVVVQCLVAAVFEGGRPKAPQNSFLKVLPTRARKSGTPNAKPEPLA
jgi:tRNA-binding EMAP/Myf-like protein